jgi:hypothetical protein
MKTIDYVKANRKGSREAELMNRTGWVSVHKVHKSKKQYNRKDNKKAINFDGFSIFIFS